MVLKLNKTVLEDRNSVFKIFFQDESSDSECVIFNNNVTTQDNTFIWIESRLKACGIQQRVDAGNIIFNQTIIIQYGNSPTGGLIYREEFDSYDVNCKVTRNKTAEIFIGTVTETSLKFKKSKIVFAFINIFILIKKEIMQKGFSFHVLNFCRCAPLFLFCSMVSAFNFCSSVCS